MATSVLVNNLNLNTLGFQVDVLTGRRSVPIRRDFGLELPGVHGVTGGVGPFDVQPIGLELWVDDADRSTGLPGTTYEQRLEVNFATVASAFMRPTGLVDLSVTDTDGLQKIATCRLTAYLADQDARRIKVGLEILKVWWRGPSDLTFASTVFGSTVNIDSTLAAAKSTAPIGDAVFTVIGPCVSPKVTCSVSGQTVEALSLSLAAGEKWELDCGKRTSRKILTGGGANSVMSTTKYVSTQLGAPILEIWPTNYDLSNPNRYRINVSASSTSSGANWTLKAKPAYY